MIIKNIEAGIVFDLYDYITREKQDGHETHHYGSFNHANLKSNESKFKYFSVRFN